MEFINDFNITDWVIVGIFVLSIIYGLMRGLFKEVGSLATWLVAIFVAIMFYDQFSAFLAEYIEDDRIRQVVSIIILFLAVIFVGGILNILLSHIVSVFGLGFIDKFFGGIFGFIRAGVLIAVPTFLLGMFNMDDNEFLSESVLVKELKPYGEMIYNVLPESWQDTIEGYADDAREPLSVDSEAAAPEAEAASDDVSVDPNDASMTVSVESPSVTSETNLDDFTGTVSTPE